MERYENTFKIVSARFEDLKSRIKRVQNKCNACKIKIMLESESVEEVKDSNGSKHDVKFLNIKVVIVYNKGEDSTVDRYINELIDMLELASNNTWEWIRDYVEEMYDCKEVMEKAFIAYEGMHEFVKRNGVSVSSYEVVEALIRGKMNVDEVVSEKMRELGISRSNNIDMSKYTADTVMYLQSGEDTEYKRKMKKLSGKRKCKLSDINLFSYLPYAVEGYLKKKKEESAKNAYKANSQWLYQEGDRVELSECKITKGYSYGTRYGDYTYYEIMKDGNVYMWKTTKQIKDGVYDLKGTVLENEEVDGIKQTNLTRCKVVECKKN